MLQYPNVSLQTAGKCLARPIYLIGYVGIPRNEVGTFSPRRTPRIWHQLAQIESHAALTSCIEIQLISYEVGVSFASETNLFVTVNRLVLTMLPRTSAVGSIFT